MNVLDLLVGKKMKLMTDLKVEVELVIKEVKCNNHSRELEPATAANDWWPTTSDWTTYTVEFTNGGKKEFDSLDRIQVY